MSNPNRVAYFGTSGYGIAGHYFKAIVGEFTNKEENNVVLLDSNKTLSLFDGKKQFVFFTYGKYRCMAFNGSPDDKRDGSITIVLVENATENKEVINAIEQSSFLKNQFERLVKQTGIIMPKFG